MTHTTEIVAYKKLSNGQMAVVIRCCGDASAEWTHTMAAAVLADPAKRSASIDAARQLAVKAHQERMDAEAAAVELMGEQVEHGNP